MRKALCLLDVMPPLPVYTSVDFLQQVSFATAPGLSPSPVQALGKAKYIKIKR